MDDITSHQPKNHTIPTMDDSTALALPVFKSSNLRFVCISDTHNDDCRRHIPDGDILLHAGDLTDFGTMEEMRKAVDWISSLPHPVKVIIAGNHDMGLDPSHPAYDPEIKPSLLTSTSALKAGIHYLDREVATVCYFTLKTGEKRPLRVYGNPMQPEFLGKPYAFVYPPATKADAARATMAWESAPVPLPQSDHVEPAVDVWLMHSPPIGRLDRVPVPGLTGCSVQADRISTARPRLCVFGHYHYSWGIERIFWQNNAQWQPKKGSGLYCHDNENDIVEAKLLVASPERQAAEGFEMPIITHFDFSGSGDGDEGWRLKKLIPGEHTLYVNAGWMTMRKTETEYRNPPFVLIICLEE